jgi:hypothetical protein
MVMDHEVPLKPETREEVEITPKKTERMGKS